MAKEPKTAKEAAETAGTMADDTSPIGLSADGGLNVVDKDSPPWKPKVLDADGNEVDPDSIEEDAPDDDE